MDMDESSVRARLAQARIARLASLSAATLAPARIRMVSRR